MHPARRIHYRRRRIAAVAIAIFAQLHLFFVLELHHHGADFVPFAQPNAASSIQKHHQSGPVDDPACPACHICRQGSVQAQVASPVPSLSLEVQRVVLAPAVRFCSRFPVLVCGRSPPRLS
jgi:hypothetical protein